MSARLVVIEGPDGAGKTTLARAVCDALGYDYAHEGPPPAGDDPLSYYRARCFHFAVELMAHPRAWGVVVDRFALGDRVYGPALRGLDRLGERGWAEVRGMLDQVGAVRVLCLPPYESCLEAWRRRADEGREFIQQRFVFDRTYSLWTEFRDDPGQLVYDWTRDAPSHVISEVTKC